MLLQKKYFTRGERILGRLLQENHIPFKTKVKINNKEIDFLIKDIVIEIDGHPQNEKKNEMISLGGYELLHFTNKEILDNRYKVVNLIINKLK